MSLLGKKIRDTYQAILNLNGDNLGLDATAKTIKDGLGVESPLALATDKVVIHGNRYPTTDGTVGQVITTNGSGELSWSSVIPANAGSFTEYFQSAQIPTTKGTFGSIAHGMSGVPRLKQVSLVCKVPEWGYTVGEEFDPSNWTGYAGASVTSDNTNLSYYIASTAAPSAFVVVSKLDRIARDANVPNWNMIIRAWR